jgi:hypothetical protein
MSLAGTDLRGPKGLNALMPSLPRMSAGDPSAPVVAAATRGHAGVDRDGMTVVAYDSVEELKSLLDKIGIRLDGVGRLLDADGRGIHCCSCEKDIAVSDVGHVMPGSTYVYCKDPVCILDYVERFG